MTKNAGADSTCSSPGVGWASANLVMGSPSPGVSVPLELRRRSRSHCANERENSHVQESDCNASQRRRRNDGRVRHHGCAHRRCLYRPDYDARRQRFVGLLVGQQRDLTSLRFHETMTKMPGLTLSSSPGSIGWRRKMDALIRLARDAKGATIVEYAIMLGLIALVCIAIVALLGSGTHDLFATLNRAWNSR